MKKITPFLWFNTEAEEAANFYTSIFKNSKVGNITRYSKEAAEAANMKEGVAMTVPFTIEGEEFTALNGGPIFKFTEAISFVVNCDSQEEIDYYWDKLSEGGDVGAQQCGWLKDKFGLSWQVVPQKLSELLGDGERAKKVMPVLMKMKKLNIKELEDASK